VDEKDVIKAEAPASIHTPLVISIQPTKIDLEYEDDRDEFVNEDYIIMETNYGRVYLHRDRSSRSGKKFRGYLRRFDNYPTELIC
jgi:hypothetical protein